MHAWTPRLTPSSVTLIGVLLVVVGFLQYRWVGELSELGRQHMRDGLRAASERFVADFDREFERIWDVFRARRDDDFPDEIASAFAEWRATSPFPDLVEEAYWVRAEDDRPVLYRVGANGVVPAVWPEHLTDLAAELRQDWQLGRRPLGSYVAMLGPRLLAFVVSQRVSIPSHAVVLLRRDVLTNQLIPSRMREFVAGSGRLDYDIVVVDEALVHPPEEAEAVVPDLRVSLSIPNNLAYSRDGQDSAQRWSVLLQHRAGSLETAIDQVRRRNLVIGAGVLALLAASVFSLVAATRRAQNLADLQVQFVAGVSHELRTPISGISSLSQNLADGVIEDLAQVREYGATIHRESGRLAGMIESVLQFSALRAGKRSFALRPMAVSEAIDDALEAIGERMTRQYRFETSLEEPLPAVLGDPQALSSALQNLLSNAMKFSKQGALIRLSSRSTQPGRRTEVQISVEDEGPGIPPDEHAHIFEPFFRGAYARTQQIQGSGLGLSLVRKILEAHGGRVSYAPATTGGSVFTLHLPMAPADIRRRASDADG